MVPSFRDTLDGIGQIGMAPEGYRIIKDAPSDPGGPMRSMGLF